MEAMTTLSPSMQALFMSFSVILVSEIGDKTFFIACIMAMSHPRLVIFSAAISSLIVMTVLSAWVGNILPALLLSKHLTKFLAGLLFLIFGAKMLWDARGMTGSEAQEEMEEVEQQLFLKSAAPSHLEHLSALESGTASSTAGITPPSAENAPLREPHDSAPLLPPHPASKPKSRLESWSISCGNVARFFLSEVWIEAFVLTFLAEWGDRSQIATVALAGSSDFWYVSAGSILGHALCTFLAVMGGRFLASRISAKSITYIGAVLFAVFGVWSLLEATWSITSTV